MVVTREGKELERRTVRGNGHWQYETFAFAATNAGINLYQARLELSREQSADWPLRPPGSVPWSLEQYPGESVADLVENPAFKKAPSGTGTISQLDTATAASSTAPGFAATRYRLKAEITSSISARTIVPSSG